MSDDSQHLSCPPSPLIPIDQGDGHVLWGLCSDAQPTRATGNAIVAFLRDHPDRRFILNPTDPSFVDHHLGNLPLTEEESNLLFSRTEVAIFEDDEGSWEVIESLLVWSARLTSVRVLEIPEVYPFNWKDLQAEVQLAFRSMFPKLQKLTIGGTVAPVVVMLGALPGLVSFSFVDWYEQGQEVDEHETLLKAVVQHDGLRHVRLPWLRLHDIPSTTKLLILEADIYDLELGTHCGPGAAIPDRKKISMTVPLIGRLLRGELGAVRLVQPFWVYRQLHMHRRFIQSTWSRLHPLFLGLFRALSTPHTSECLVVSNAMWSESQSARRATVEAAKVRGSTFVLAFERANRGHPLQASGLDFVPEICKMIGTDRDAEVFELAHFVCPIHQHNDRFVPNVNRAEWYRLAQQLRRITMYDNRGQMTRFVKTRYAKAIIADERPPVAIVVEDVPMTAVAAASHSGGPSREHKRKFG